MPKNAKLPTIRIRVRAQTMVDRILTSSEARLSRGNLAYLQEESLAVIAVIAGAIGYIWLWVNIWPVTGSNAPLSSWIGSSVLIGGAPVNLPLATNHLHVSTQLLI